MFTAIYKSYQYLDSIDKAAFERQDKCGICFVYSDKKKLEVDTVMKDVGLS